MPNDTVTFDELAISIKVALSGNELMNSIYSGQGVIIV
jgi:hypothetical protein